MIKIANAPCSCGILEFDLEEEAAGYADTELGDWGFMSTMDYLSSCYIFADKAFSALNGNPVSLFLGDYQNDQSPFATFANR